MATDGVKIIDGDAAHDTYWGIMDLYDSGVDLKTIRETIPFVQDNLGADTDFYHEIFVTAYALAFWEIGELADEIRDEVRRVIDLGEDARVWTRECDKKEGEKRQKELDKLWKKISQPNSKIRKRKIYREIKNLYFEPDDLLAFKLSDNKYRALICAKVTQHRGQCTYDFVPTTYIGAERPSVHALLNCFIPGLKCGSGYDKETTLSYQPGVDEIWAYHGNESNFFFGVPYYLVAHKDIVSFKNRFELVGKLRIKESLKRLGSYGYESSFEDFHRIFQNLNEFMKTFKQRKYPVQLLCETYM